MERSKKVVGSKFLSSLLLILTMIGCKVRRHEAVVAKEDLQIYQIMIDANQRILKTPSVKLYIVDSTGFYGLSNLQERISNSRPNEQRIVEILRKPEWKFTTDIHRLLPYTMKVLNIKRETFTATKHDKYAMHYVSPVIFSDDKKRAAIYYEFIYGTVSRGSIIYIFEQKGNVWYFVGKEEDPLA